MNSATFVLSTGRCGTQWLAEKLASAYGDLLTVTHEPLDNDYRPRLMLGQKTPLRLDPDSRTTLLDHVERIERVVGVGRRRSEERKRQRTGQKQSHQKRLHRRSPLNAE